MNCKTSRWPRGIPSAHPLDPTDLSFSPDLIWNTVLQYDNLSNLLTVNSRIRWTFQPGSDFFSC